MPRPGRLGMLALPVVAMALLNSCGIRLPDTPAPTYRMDVRKLSSAPEPVPGKEPDVLVWLISDELHTGMVFQYDWLLESGFIPPEGFGTPKYVTLSWGNRTAYVEKGLHSPGKFFMALFTPSPSVMELIPANWNVTEVCPHQRIWRKLVARERGKDLAAFLNDCSKQGTDGRPILCGTSSWGGGVLLESRHVYFIPRICNIWTAQVIESLGGKMNAWSAVTANGLIRQAERPPNDFEQIWWGGGNQFVDPNKQAGLTEP
ncbi:MAG: DUF2459 domain-containing protein [Verrucomicrobiota bacterium]